MPIHAVTRPRDDGGSAEKYTARVGLIGGIAAVLLSGVIAYAAGAQQSDVDYKRERRDSSYIDLLDANDAIFRIERELVAIDKDASVINASDGLKELDQALEDYSAASNSTVLVESDAVAAVRRSLDACHSQFREVVQQAVYVAAEVGQHADDGAELTIYLGCSWFEPNPAVDVSNLNYSPMPVRITATLVAGRIARYNSELREAMRSDING